MDRILKQIEFIREIDKLKQVFRQSLISDGSRRENDAEHSWHLAIMVALLAEHAPAPIDALRAMKMALIHDIVEIDAGDVFIYSTEKREEAVKAERAAAERLFGMLPSDQAAECRALWEEFEARVTPEARFARALDRLQPILLNLANQGEPWRKHKVTAEQVASLNLPIVESGAPALAPLLKEWLADAHARGFFHNEA